MTPRFTTADGLSLAHYAWGAGNPGPPVVLHHAFVAHARLKGEQSPAVPDAVLRVVAGDHVSTVGSPELRSALVQFLT